MLGRADQGFVDINAMALNAAISGHGWRCAMADDALSSLARWHAVEHYRADTGLIDVEMLLHEMADLHDRIECGPHWDTIERIEIRRINHIDSATLTLEQAQK